MKLKVTFTTDSSGASKDITEIVNIPDTECLFCCHDSNNRMWDLVHKALMDKGYDEVEYFLKIWKIYPYNPSIEDLARKAERMAIAIFADVKSWLNKDHFDGVKITDNNCVTADFYISYRGGDFDEDSFTFTEEDMNTDDDIVINKYKEELKQQEIKAQKQLEAEKKSKLEYEEKKSRALYESLKQKYGECGK